MFWNNSSQVNETSLQQNRDDGNLETTLYKGIFGSIAVLAFLGNLLLCFVICRRRDLLSKPYNILILNLTATDLLTGMSKHYYSNKSYSPVAQWLERPSKY